MIEVLKQALEALEKVKRRAVVMGSTGDYREGQLDALKAVSEDVKPAIASLQQAIAKLESQEPVACGTYQEVTDTMNALWAGTLEQVQIAEEMKNKKLYTAPPQRTEQEQPLPPVEIGVDVTADGASVVAFYRRSNAVMEMFYSQFHPVPQRTRVVFPTILRKMWSGGEVQDWLDENVNKEKNT